MAQHKGKTRRRPQPGWRRDDSAFRIVREQLRAFFAGELHEFDFRCGWRARRFSGWSGKDCWRSRSERRQLRGARPADRAARRARAVGAANGRNPIGIVVPCHRVIAADGTLGGYGGGLDRKEWLLAHEASVLDRQAKPQPRIANVAARSFHGLNWNDRRKLTPGESRLDRALSRCEDRADEP